MSRCTNGVVNNINAYDKYGIPNATNAGRFQYTGQVWLPELGMYHYKARIYSPTLCRFLQTDPIGYEDQINLYAYVANDPVNMFDPTGENGWRVWIERLRATVDTVEIAAKVATGQPLEANDVSQPERPASRGERAPSPSEGNPRPRLKTSSGSGPPPQSAPRPTPPSSPNPATPSPTSPRTATTIKGIGVLGILTIPLGVASGQIRTDTPEHFWYDSAEIPVPGDLYETLFGCNDTDELTTCI